MLPWLIQSSKILFFPMLILSQNIKTPIWKMSSPQMRKRLLNNQVLNKPINQYWFVKPDCLHTKDCTIKWGSWEQGLGSLKWVTILFQILIKTWNQTTWLCLSIAKAGYEQSQERGRGKIRRAPIFLRRCGPSAPQKCERGLKGPVFPRPSPQKDTKSHFLLGNDGHKR